MDHIASSHGLPWLTSPLRLHSSRDSGTCSLTPAQCAYKSRHWVNWYQADHVYALAVVYFVCAAVGVFAVMRWAAAVRVRWRAAKRTEAAVSVGLQWRALAAWRWLGYRRWRLQVGGLGTWWSPACGVMLLGLLGMAFLLGLTLGPTPYYWPNTKTLSFGNSPPLATRAGWMALALLPFLFAFSAKASLVTALTGVSHEKLQVFHRWIAYAMFVLALVHTFPFIVFHVWKGDMETQWNTSVEYWSGVAALVPQAYLTVMSFGPIRNRYYEFFKSTHYLAAVVFVVFFFIHCDFRLSSWDYFIATGCVYLPSLLYASLRTLFRHGVCTATFTLLPHNVLKISVPIGPATTWKPGQHVFLRFLTLGPHALTAHPFTICSLPARGKERSHNEILFYVAPTGGLTSRLVALARARPTASVNVLIDGPYGGMDVAKLRRARRVLLVAGGSGAGLLLPMVEDLLESRDGEAGPQVRIVVAVKQEEAAKWVEDAVREVCERFLDVGRDTVLDIHVTGGDCGKDADWKDAPEENSEKVKISGETKPSMQGCGGFVEVRRARGRPRLPEIVKSMPDSQACSVAVAVCGPQGMLYDVQNAVAREQDKVVRGEINGDIWMHSEVFSW